MIAVNNHTTGVANQANVFSKLIGSKCKWCYKNAIKMFLKVQSLSSSVNAIKYVPKEGTKC